MVRVLERSVPFALILFVFFPGAPHASDNRLPFHPGEKMIFQLRWGFIPAGEAVLEVLPLETLDGARTHHFVLTARTNKFADFFYRVRQRIDAYADVGLHHSLLYKNFHTYGKKKKTDYGHV